LPVLSNDSAELIKCALKGLDLIFQDGYHFQKAGVMVTELVPEDELQHNLFDTEDRKRSKVLMKTLDRINKTFGKNTLRVASQGYERRWKLRAEKLSPCYTTDIAKLPSVKCYV
jgi:DNA polymerase V